MCVAPEPPGRPSAPPGVLPSAPVVGAGQGVRLSERVNDRQPRGHALGPAGSLASDLTDGGTKTKGFNSGNYRL